MALKIDATVLPDPPTFTDFTLGANLIGGFFQITGNPARVEVLYGQYGMRDSLPALEVATGSYSVTRSPSGLPLSGIRAQNATAGLGAVLAGYFWTESDPTVSFIGQASSQVAGSVVIPIVQLVDFPPGSPTDGQTIYLETGIADVRWLLTYNATTLRWDYAGGPPIYNEVTAGATRDNIVYGDLGGSPGPLVTVPRVGTYFITHGFRISSISAASQFFVSYSIGGVGAVDADAIISIINPVTAFQGGMTRTRLKAFATNDVLTARYRNTPASVVGYADRFISIYPQYLT